ncbi:MAG: DNA/RNA non-specific endonuclease [Bacteroidales bacterium]|nr:DNA/RNA non-specific endonuclease [Bacteroidales bacterium]
MNIQLTLERTEIEGERFEQILHLQTDPPGKPWTIAVDPESEWCSFSRTSGTGEAHFFVTAAQNQGEPRTAIITATSGNSSASVELIQFTMTLVQIFGNTNFSNYGQAQNLRIETELDWTAEITEGSSFARLDSTTSGTGDGWISVTFYSNPNGTARRANLRITAKNEDVSQDINLTLTQGHAYGNIERYVPMRIELPQVRDTTWFIQHKVGDIVNFALEYDTGQRHSFWVAYILTDALLVNNRPNTHNFGFDPKIPRELQPHRIINGQIALPNYWGAPYNYRYERGHLIPSADRRFSQEANTQTDFLSNISPHLPEFHGIPNGVWLNLENQVRTWGGQANIDTLYIVKGGAIIPPGPGDQRYIVEVLTRLNRTVVPRYYFKALVQRRGDEFHGIAFWLRQERWMARRAPTRADAVTIRELERLTGINFFPNLSVVGEQLGQPNLEEIVETTPINWSRWPGM